MAKNKKEVRPDEPAEKTSKALLTVMVLMAGAIVVAACYLWFGVINKPILVLGAPETEVEAGEVFDEWSMVTSLTHATQDMVKIDLGSLDTETPGDYKVTYTLRTHFGEESLPVNVKVSDTTAPELTVVESPLEKKRGDTVKVEELVVSSSDRSGVTCTFEDGSTEVTFSEGGDFTRTVVAVDGAGNEARADVSFHIEVVDEEAPVLSGVVNTAVKVGESFDVMEGISASDDLDTSLQVRSDVSAVDTSTTGATVIHYTVTDASGKSAEGERIVTVADDVIEYDGRKYGVYWDLAGRDGQPYLVAVNRPMDTVTVYQMDESGRYSVPVNAFVCSTGPATPAGTYKTLERSRWQYLYDNCWGQYATRIIGHILFHSVPYFTQNPGDLEYEQYNLLGTPASLGCIRLCVEDVKWIYDNCPQGFTCVIYDDSVTPGPMGKPEPLHIDPADDRRGWDPTDPDPNNPWLAAE